MGRYYIDTSYYGGMLDKSHEDFYRYILLYPAIAFFLHCTWCLVFLVGWVALAPPDQQSILWVI